MSEAISKAKIGDLDKVLKWIEENSKAEGFWQGNNDLCIAAHDALTDAVNRGEFAVYLSPTDVDVKEIEDTLKNALIVNDRYDHYNAKLRLNAQNWFRQLLTKLSETNGWLQNANDAIETLNGELDYERNENESLRKAVAEKEVEVKQLNRQILENYKTAKELFGGLSLDEFMAKYNETLAQVTQKEAEIDDLKSTYGHLAHQLNQAVEALEEVRSNLKARGGFFSECVCDYIDEALQSIKGGDPNVETTT